MTANYGVNEENLDISVARHGSNLCHERWPNDPRACAAEEHIPRRPGV